MPSARGPYRKGREKRAQILDTALTVIERNGYSNATVKELADAVGLSQNGLLHHFGSKDELYLEILRHRDEGLEVTIGRDQDAIAETFRERVLAAAANAAAAPGLIQLSMRLAAEASESDHTAHEFFRNRYTTSLHLTQEVLRLLQQDGRVRADIDPDRAATLLYAAIEGLQLQWAYDPDLDMEAHLAYLLSLLGIGGPPVPPTANAAI